MSNTTIPSNPQPVAIPENGSLPHGWAYIQQLWASHHAAFLVCIVIGVLFIIALVAWAVIYGSTYKIPVTQQSSLTLETYTLILRDQANLLQVKLQRRVQSYGVLNTVLVLVEITGSLYFTLTGLGQFNVHGQNVQQVPIDPRWATFVGAAILLAGLLKAAFQPSRLHSEYESRECIRRCEGLDKRLMPTSSFRRK